MEKIVMLLVLLAPFALADCVELIDGATISESTTLCGDTFDIPSGITITGKDIVFDCNSAILRGTSGQSDIGIRVEDAERVTIKNCNILTFDQGLLLKRVSNALIEDNALLKNRIGIRMMDAYENIIRDNNDKSFQLPVSAVNSKFNVVMLGNRDIDREFCAVNVCNEEKEMDVCVSNDFYCSEKCSPESDSDCGPMHTPEPIMNEPQRPSVDELIKQAKDSVEIPVKPMPAEVIQSRKLSLKTKLLIYALLYLFAFIFVQVKKR